MILNRRIRKISRLGKFPCKIHRKYLIRRLDDFFSGNQMREIKLIALFHIEDNWENGFINKNIDPCWHSESYIQCNSLILRGSIYSNIYIKD